MFPDKTFVQQNKEEKLSDEILSTTISSPSQHPLIEAISSYASFSFSQNSSSLHKIFEETLDENLLEQPSKQTSIKHIVLKYALDDNDLFNETTHNNNRKILSVKEKVIMNALIHFHQKIKNSEPKKVIEYTKQSDYAQEMKLYTAVENSVRNKLINKKEPSSSKSKDIGSCVNLGKLLFGVRGKNKTLEFFPIKVIIISMINLLNEIVSALLLSFNHQNTVTVNIEIFVHLYKKFLLMSNICPYIENDYSLTFDSFRKKYQLNFTLSELFSDIFWDVVFSYKQLSCCFISNINGDVTQTVHGVMMKIITALWITELPLKKQISELLDIEKIIGEKPDLATFIVQEKEGNNDKQYLHDEREPENSWNLFNFNEEKSHQSINVNMVIETNKVTKDTKIEETVKEPLPNTITATKEEEPKKVTTVSTGTNTIISKTDNKSLEEIYNDIVNVNKGPSNPKRKSKKKNKRKKSPVEEDPIVAQFKSELCGKVVNAGEIQKIKPMISSEWIQKITFNA